MWGLGLVHLLGNMCVGAGLDSPAWRYVCGGWFMVHLIGDMCVGAGFGSPAWRTGPKALFRGFEPCVRPQNKIEAKRVLMFGV